ncbi:hypothetical protein K1T71_004853 [Dendrolimus kikuchii]|uniref:Uncharacterized protein n=1 Tax=Dendrolimus kikuchii TaxID=765133 RepID=A0ACC1D5J2_9NEOP|nr:hypothetical protein K1T71_004853 [Dendrolimus kikuchii]
MIKIKEICKLLLLLLCYESEAHVETRYYPRYHIAPLFGWMNDPNGFSFFKCVYHLFFQYNPYSSKSPGITNWGHVVSKNLVDWSHEPIAMKPDEYYDKDGVFSGCAIVENGELVIFYTGNVNLENNSYMHREVQALAYSKNGINITKYANNPIIKGNHFQPNFRDPKVWKEDYIYYMVLGNSLNDTFGRVLLYQSRNLINWEYQTVLAQSNGTLGYMWECPDFFKLGNYYVLLFSPQGIKPQGDKYRNLYQVGYFVGEFDKETKYFNILTEFREVNRGHDFYATQTMLDKSGRRLMVAWNDMWGQSYPESNEGFKGELTFITELSLSSDLRLIQKPIRELRKLIVKKLFSGKCSADVLLPDKTGKAIIRASNAKDFTLYVQDASNNSNKVTVQYNSKIGYVTLNRGGEDGIRGAEYKPSTDLCLVMLVDASSVELFFGKGELTFASRFFPNGDIIIRQEIHEAYNFTVYMIRRSVPFPE